MEKTTYTVLMRDNTTGEVREFPWETDMKEETIVHCWSDGNFGCDCNRDLHFSGQSYVTWGGAKCGDGKYFVISITNAAGRVVYADREEE